MGLVVMGVVAYGVALMPRDASRRLGRVAANVVRPATCRKRLREEIYY